MGHQLCLRDRHLIGGLMKFGYASPRLAKFLFASTISTMALCSAQTVWANCTTTGTTVVCDASAPNPYTNPVSGTNITLNPGAQVQPVDPFAGAALGYDSVLLSAAGQLNAQTGSSIVNTFGGKAVVAGAGSTVNMGARSPRPMGAPASIWGRAPRSSWPKAAT